MRTCMVVLLTCAVVGCGTVARGAEPATATSLLERGKALHREVPLIDGHNDLPWELRKRVAGDLSKMDIRQPLPQVQTDIPRLRAGGVGGVFFAAYTPTSMAERGIAARVTLEQIDLIHRMVQHAPQHLEFARTADDVERIHRAGKIAAMIGVEGGHTIENSLALLRQFHALGVRYMTLTHTDSTDWADACPPATPRHGGLAPFGVEVVREMNRLGMLVDISHVSDDTMRDVLEVSDAPVIASHSSARGVATGQPRNVPDDVLRMIHNNGGVVMVNFFSGYLVPETPQRVALATEARERILKEFTSDEERRSEWRKWMRANPPPPGDVATVADHIDHIVRVAGIDHVGLGSDYDGVSVLPEGLEDVSCYPNLTAELLRRGYSDDDVKKVLGLNILRVMRQAEEIAKCIQKERPPSMATTVPATLLKDLPTSRPASAR